MDSGTLRHLPSEGELLINTPTLKFIFCSLAGASMFLFPIYTDGRWTITFDVLMASLRAPFDPHIEATVTLVVCIVALGSLIYPWLPRRLATQRTIRAAFSAPPVWRVLRLGGALIGVLLISGYGPGVVIADDTGGMVYSVIGPALLFSLTTARFLMPLLTDFGLLEFVGVVLRRPFRAAFRLPGRAAVDATTSILSSASVGLLLTLQQFDKGVYTPREASAIATSFSLVSVPFSLVVVQTAGIQAYFFPWYLCVLIGCVLCAAVMVRIPPLSSLPHEQNTDVTMNSGGVWSDALQAAVRRAEAAPSWRSLIGEGTHNAVVAVANVIAPSMLLATLTSMLVFHTSFFDYLSYPLFLLFDVLQLAHADLLATGSIIGVLDQFMPAVVASGTENSRTSFVLAGLSVSQVIYLSEVGVLILRSGLPLHIGHLFMIFGLRTLLLLPWFFLASLIVVSA